MNKPRLLFVVESPFSERDRRRFGIPELRDLASVSILDICPVVKPHLPNSNDVQSTMNDVTVVESIEHALSELNRIQPTFTLLNLGNHEARNSIITTARAINSDVVEFQLGAIPEDDALARPWLLRLRHSARMQPDARSLIRHFRTALLRRLRNVADTPDHPDVFVYAGLAALHHVDARTPRRIPAHSFDCELFRSLEHEPRGNNGLAVYLDQELGYHPDLEHDRLRSPVEPVRFHSDLRRFFDRFSSSTGMEVGVAVHPRADRDHVRDRLGYEVRILDDTARSIRDARVVLSHASTAISFAVLWGVPSISLTSRHIRRGWYGPLVDRFADALGSPLLHLDDADEPSILAAVRRPVNLSAYENYRTRYLTTNMELRPLWPSILEALQVPRHMGR